MSCSVFCCSRQGSRHIALGVPCQDASGVLNKGFCQIAVVADGHGHRRHFRSQTGSKLACKAAEDALLRFVQNGFLSDAETFIEPLKAQILHSWRTWVLQDLKEKPWSAEELRILEEYRSEASLSAEEEALIPYGTTLIASLRTDALWIGLQIGDGDLIRIGEDGSYDRLIPQSLVNSGHNTASLCMANAMEEFRHCIERENPRAIFLYTDGIEKTFKGNEEPLLGLFLWVLTKDIRTHDDFQPQLQDLLDKLSAKSSLGDDMTLAGILSGSEEIPKLHPGKTIQTQEQQKLAARLEELEGTLFYNQQRLADLLAKGTEDEKLSHLETIIQRIETEIEELHRQLDAFRVAEDII